MPLFTILIMVPIVISEHIQSKGDIFSPSTPVCSIKGLKD